MRLSRRAKRDISHPRSGYIAFAHKGKNIASGVSRIYRVTRSVTKEAINQRPTSFLPSRKAAAKGFPAGEAGAGVYGRPRLMRGRGAGLNLVPATEFVFALRNPSSPRQSRGASPTGKPNRERRFGGLECSFSNRSCFALRDPSSPRQSRGASPTGKPNSECRSGATSFIPPPKPSLNIEH